MEIEKIKSIIEAILFAAGRQVSIKELRNAQRGLRKHNNFNARRI